VAPGTSLRSFLARFAIALVVVVVATGVGVVAGDDRFDRLLSDIANVDIAPEVFEEEVRGEPANFLVVGSDSRAFVSNEGEAQSFGTEDEVGGARSDTTMVVHVDPDTRTGFVVAFPRDLRVEIPGHGEQRLNAAFGLGGPELVIRTLQENFDIPIHHYLEVDFAGFREIVDTIGGVDIWFPTPARDRYTGLDVPEAGCRELNGAQGLEYVRSRHYSWFDAEAGRWREDPLQDLNRIKRQQYFMRSLAEAALDRGASNPVVAFQLLDDVSGALRKDPELGEEDLKGLINAFRDLDPASIEMATIPVEAGRGGALELREADAAPILDRLRNFSGLEGFEPPADPATVRVAVLNGSGARGRAREVLDLLLAHGYRQAADPADADRDDYPLTAVRYAPGEVRKGLTVASALGTLDVAERQDLPAGTDVVVIVGRDWETVDAPVKRPPDETSTSGTGASTAASTATTTTAPPSPSATALVPVDPQTGGPLVGCP
jgi:LCP family protein required for cell wall assembly